MSPIIKMLPIVLLAVVVPASQAYRLNNHAMKNFCPPFGNPGTEYEITVLSADRPSLGGCAVPRARWNTGDFEMWLGEGGNCTTEEMDYFHFNCISTWKFSDLDNSNNWTFVLLHDTATEENSSRRSLRCALYQVFDGGAKIVMAISGDKLQPGTGCNDAAIFVNLPENDSDIIASSMPNRPILIQMNRAESEAVFEPEPLMGKESEISVTRLLRKRRSPTDVPDFGEHTDNTCRFPEYTQGQWSNLRIDGGAIRYVYVYNPDDFDNEGINNDPENQSDEGEDGDAELQTRRRTRREVDSSGLEQTVENINNSIPPMPLDFNVEEFIKNHNLTDFAIDRLDVMFLDYFKLIKNSMAAKNDSKPSVSSKSPSHNITHSISPFDDNDDEGINYESKIEGYKGMDGDEVVQTKRRIRREFDSSEFMQTAETIKDSIPPMPANFDVKEFIRKRNLTNIDFDHIGAMFINYFKPINTTTATNNKSELLAKKTSRKQRSTSSNINNEENAKKVDKFRKIARIERLWDEQLRNDIQRAFETFDYYGFPEKIHHSVNKVPTNPTAQANPTAEDYFKKPILEAWDSFKSLFGFSTNDEQPIFPPTPPSSPPPTPPNTPPRSSVVTNDQRFGVKIGSLLDGQINKKNNYVKYSYESSLEPINRKKRCFGGDPTTTKSPIVAVFGEFDEHNLDHSMDTIDKFNKEHDVLNNDKLHSRNANIPVLILDQMNKQNVKINNKRAATPNTLEKIIYKIGDFFTGKKSESAKPKEPVMTGYSLDFQDDETSRQKRSAEDDYEAQVAMEYGEMEEEVRRAPIVAEERAQRFMNWWTDYRNSKMEMYSKEYNLSEQLKEVEYQKYPEMRPMPSAIEFLDMAQSLGEAYRTSLIQWRSLEREHRMWLANLEFIAFPGQNHPDVSLGDFDHTYDGIELEFDPLHPEGTAEDPTAYRVYTVPGGGPRIGSRLNRYDEWERKHPSGSVKASNSDYNDYYDNDDYVSGDASENKKPFKAPISDFAYGPRIKDGKIVDGLRTRRSADDRPSQTMGPQKFAWRCVQSAQDFGDTETFGNKFLTMGGRIYDDETGPAVSMPQDDDKLSGDISFEQMYGCLWLVSRGPNVLEFSVLATGMPRVGQDMKSFAQELCTEDTTQGRDSRARNKNKLRPRRRWWFTETRTDEKNRVQVSCPVPPGTVFYGVVPAPPPPQSSDPNAPPSFGSRQMCARLVSSADSCQPGDAGREDRMKYTVSDCVEQQVSTDGTLPPEVINAPKPQDVFEERSYQCLGQWTEMQQNGPDEPSALLTYTYVKRIDSVNPGAPEYECFVGTTIPNDLGRDPITTTTLMLTEAGTGNRCSRLADPFKSGMKLIGTKIGQGAACAGNGPSGKTGGSWYPMQPQELPAGAEKGAGLSAVPNPSTMLPVAAGSSTWNPGKKDKEPVFVRPAPPSKENSAVVFKNSAVAIIAVLAHFFIF